MSKRNPIKSMTGNMWAALRKMRKTGEELYDVPAFVTNSALVERKLARFTDDYTVRITDLGRMVCDAFTEGQESVR